MSQLDVATLHNGINTGISALYQSKVRVQTFGGGQYTLSTGADGNLIFTLNASVTSPTCVWDSNWGSEELARSASAETLAAQYFPVAAAPTGLAAIDAYRSSDNVVAAKIYGASETPSTPRRNDVYGGVYSDGRIDPAGQNLTTDVWLDVASGSLNLVAGGSFTESLDKQTATGTPSGSWNLIGDTHLQVESGAVVNSVVGGNVGTRSTSSHTGDSYISVYSSNLQDSVIGGGLFFGTDSSKMTQTGDSTVNIYKALSLDAAVNHTKYNTEIADYSAGELVTGTGAIIAPNVIAGSHVALHADGDTSTRTTETIGDTTVTFSGFSGGKTAKIVQGSQYAFVPGYRNISHSTSGPIVQTQTGNSNIFFTNLENDSFTYMVTAIHGATLPFSDVTQTLNGDALLQIVSSGKISYKGVVGGHQICAWDNNDFSQEQDGSAIIDFQSAVTLGLMTPDPLVYSEDEDEISDNRTSTTSTSNHYNVAHETSNINVVSLVGGHYYLDVSDLSPQYTVNQDRTGSTLIEIGTLSAASTASGTITGGHYALSIDGNTSGKAGLMSITQTQEDSVTVNVTNLTSSSTSFGIVGGHEVAAYGRISTSSPYPYGRASSVTQTIEGDVTINLKNVSISSSDFSVIGGHQQINVGTSSIYGDVNINIDGTRYTNVVLGGTWNATNAYIHGIHMDLKNATFSGTSVSIAGGFYNDGLYGNVTYGDPYYTATLENASVGDIDITLTNATVTGKIYGGSWMPENGGEDDLQNRTENAQSPDSTDISDDTDVVRQGNITIELVSGTYSGDIFAGGYCAQQDVVTTASTTVIIHKDAVVNSDVVSGGYDSPDLRSVHSKTNSMVTGNRTVQFADAGSYSYNSTFTYFNYFDTVAGCYVTLNNSLQLANDTVNKTGAGTLYLRNISNEIDTLDIHEGTVKIGGSSRANNILQHVYVREGAALDVSDSTVGIRGEVQLSSGSLLTVNAKNSLASGVSATRAPEVESLVWGDSDDNRIVTLDIQNLSSVTSADGTYSVDLFTGLTRETISGLTLSSMTDVELGQELLAAHAEEYVQLADGSDVQDGYLWLRSDGTLVLTNAVESGVYWTAGQAGNWNTTDLAWSNVDDATIPDKVFKSHDVAYFTKDGTAADPAVVTLTEDVEAGSVHFVGDDDTLGHYQLDTTNGDLNISRNMDLADQTVVELTGDGEVTVARNLSLTGESSLTVEDGTQLNLSPTATVATVSGNSTLTVNNDIKLLMLKSDGTGTTTVNGDVTMNAGSSQAGTLEAEDVKLGGDTTFTQLTAAAVTCNAGNTLTTGGTSSMDSLDGGSLKVTEGTTSIGSDTSLTSLAGAGTLSMPANSLKLAQSSSIGNLTADAVTLNSSLAVANTLATDSVTFTSVDSLGTSVLLSAKKIDAGTSAATGITVSNSAVSHLFLTAGKEYKLVDSTSSSSKLLVNGAEQSTLSNNHYSFLFKSYNSGTNAGDVTVTATVSDPHYFENSMHEFNAKAGGRLMDNLLVNSSAFDDGKNTNLKNLVETVDNILLSGGDADKEGASVAGSSLATLGMAFADDMERQLKAIRNRTTCMGVDPSVENDNMPYYNAWVNAEGNTHQLTNDSLYTGYTLNNFGATVGFDVDCTPHLTCGLAMTAMFGDYTSDDADDFDGDFDTQYVTAFARYNRRAWMHTFVASVGRADVSGTRSYSVGGQKFSQDVDTDGVAFGAMYEVGRIFRLNAEGSAIIEPLVNVMYTHSSVSGFDETGSEAALKVDDITMDTFTLGAGARTQAVVGENIYNRTSVFEARALVKAYVGDRQGEADVAFAAAASKNATVKSAEAGAVGCELGAGIIVPVGGENSSVFVDASVEVRADYVNANGTIGYRINF